tara:strand:- start:206 stop:391 length:186 start_codon:yes stop_codon:yes gene_type:complete
MNKIYKVAKDLIIDRLNNNNQIPLDKLAEVDFILMKKFKLSVFKIDKLTFNVLVELGKKYH